MFCAVSESERPNVLSFTKAHTSNLSGTAACVPTYTYFMKMIRSQFLVSLRSTEYLFLIVIAHSGLDEFIYVYIYDARLRIYTQLFVGLGQCMVGMVRYRKISNLPIAPEIQPFTFVLFFCVLG